MRILVAEDERITRASIVRQLTGWGHDVTEAGDGESAWDLFRAGPFDLVLTDWEMPRLSGLELIRRIRAGEAAAYVYIIMLTSRSEKDDIVRGIEAGADDFVSKPFDRDELRARVLAGARVVGLERALSTQNVELRAAGERMRGDLEAAARVQRAMLPADGIHHPRARAEFAYVPTDQLAGDAIGFCIADARSLVAWVVDVSGHGVPAALLAVTVMHALAPGGEGVIFDRAGGREAPGVQAPSRIVAELNRRFNAANSDGRFLTMVLCTLDLEQGVLRFTRAGHPLPVLVRADRVIPVDGAGGLPLGIVDSDDYPDITVRLQPGDRVVLYSDGMVEQSDPAGVSFGDDRLHAVLTSRAGRAPAELLTDAVGELRRWAGGTSFADDVSLVVVEWRG